MKTSYTASLSTELYQPSPPVVPNICHTPILQAGISRLSWKLRLAVHRSSQPRLPPVTHNPLNDRAMQALSQRISRRKRVLPVAIISGQQCGWPWVEDSSSPFKHNSSNIDRTGSSSNTAAMALPHPVVNGESANDVGPPKTWFDLPEEIQSHIIKEVKYPYRHIHK